MKVDGTIVTANLQKAGPLAADLEAAGYDGVWTVETSHDPFLPLVAAGLATERVDLGTGIAVAFARSPMTLANTSYDLHASCGRHILGLGSQIKPHIEKRFSMPWSQPAARMREMILAIRAIWDCWHNGSKLSFEGDFYTHKLMTPMFNPGENPNGLPKIALAGVGPMMTAVAGEVADGFLCHAFTTEAYFRDVTLPTLAEGAAKAGRSLDDIEIAGPSFMVTGATEEATEAAAASVRQQLAFYGSTPAYRPVLEHHGWGELQTELNLMSKQGKWVEMGELITDEILETFAIVAEPEDIGARFHERYGDVVHRVSIHSNFGLDPDRFPGVLAALKGALKG